MINQHGSNIAGAGRKARGVLQSLIGMLVVPKINVSFPKSMMVSPISNTDIWTLGGIHLGAYTHVNMGHAVWFSAWQHTTK